MITLRKTGWYKLIETKRGTKVLYLNNDVYVWIERASIGEILVISRDKHKSDCVLSVGRFNLYDVEDEPNLFDLKHLELEVGENTWQGYVLLSGLPNSQHKKARIIPTDELITGTPLYKQREEAHHHINYSK